MKTDSASLIDKWIERQVKVERYIFVAVFYKYTSIGIPSCCYSVCILKNRNTKPYMKRKLIILAFCNGCYDYGKFLVP